MPLDPTSLYGSNVPGAEAAPAGLDHRDLILAVSPFEYPDARVVVAAQRGGALGVLDLGRDGSLARAALRDTARWAPGSFGVRVPVGCPLDPADLPASVGTVILPPGPPGPVEPYGRMDLAWRPAEVGPGRRVLVEVTSLEEARAALGGGGVQGLIARGSESGGRVGEASTFVLLQQLLGSPAVNVPVWAAGGIGRHTAAGAIAGGAVGVVIDAQLALSHESAESLPAEVSMAIGAMDGSEPVVIQGCRVFTRPDLVARQAVLTDPLAIAMALGRDLAWLPIGHDGASARAFAEEFRTVGGIVTALRASIRSHLEAAVMARPLAPGAGMARHGGSALPVAQGPMTRVSDQAAFAAEVAEAGGLPFIALALMAGDDVARLLAETADALSGRPWGVGILGFVPPELREAQLEAVRAAHPPFALIAGGRPTQSAALEADGIATFLHVPSPGLLDRFLADGARRFVFEGSECGGHIGPRASFPLWEAQIERLLVFGDGRGGGPAFFESLEVWFAGGIHDERSAAMVAALAAPLAIRGAAIGVLMGTAYLFTEEAVTSGAILPGFQEVALTCGRTVLLETSPGHVTRCAETPYVSTFAAAREALLARGATTREVWEDLEELNLGRLRIASKGVSRHGDRLVDVPAARQHEAGMFMLGQVATLRSTPTTIPALHAQVTVGASVFLDRRAGVLGLPVTRRAVREERGRRANPLDVAIVGMACVLPGADGLASYWANILAGLDAVTEVPGDRWDIGRYHRAGAHADGSRDSTPSKWGGFIPSVGFDALAYGIPPSSLAAIEPVQLLALEVATRALADAGYARRPFNRERASVVFGADGGTDLAGAYGFRARFPAYFEALPPGLDEHLPRLTEDSFPGVLANVIAGRIANRLDLGGVNFTVDAACASSLAALDVACKELTTASSDLVLCGGADLHNGIYDYLMFASAQALSPTGRCATFDAGADGIALGEGVVCVVLKRLADAERDGDRVYAVVKGVAGSSDGRSLGLTAPRAEGQTRALRRAYEMAGVSPAQVGLIEAHGTGTVVGDRTELAALTEVFAEAGAQPASCALGSVKSQIGHTKCAAGLAGLVKATHALYSGVRPPTGPIGEPNPGWGPSASPFFFDQQARPWAAPPEQRYAGVSAFGFGGTNFHAVLSAYDGAPEPAHGLQEWPAELFCLRGATMPEAVAALDQLIQLLTVNDAAGRPFALRDLAAGAAAMHATLPVQLAFVADTPDDLGAKAAAARCGQADPALGIFAAAGPGPGPDSGPGGGAVAFLYPGQGSQRPGMMADLFVAFPRLQRHLRGGAARYAPVMFPPADFTPAGGAARKDAITDTAVAQPVMGIADMAMHEVLTWLGVRPAMAGGHSYGEFPALAAAGAIRPEDLLAIGEARAAAILQAAGEDPGAMAAVRADRPQVLAALGAGAVDGRRGVVIANHNAPDQVVISGSTPAVDSALGALQAAGLTARPIPVACGFHSPVVASAAGVLARTLEQQRITPPAYPVWSNTTAQPHPGDAAGIRALLARQVAEPVRFVEQIESMYQAGARVFVEVGPGRVLTGLVGKILGDRPHAAVACDVPGEPGLRRLLLAIAELAAAGVPVDTTPLFRGRGIQPALAGAVPARPGWKVDGHLVRTADGRLLAGGLRPSREFQRPRWDVSAPAPDAAVAARDATVLEFLRATRETIAAQRDVMLGYLGSRREPGSGFDGVTVPAVTAPPLLAAASSARDPQPAGGAGPQELTRERVLAGITAIVGQRTGYPPEMLGADLDLEADLSIDSIKRTEIIMELSGRFQLVPPGAPASEGVVEALARLKTIAAIVAWILDHAASATAPTPAPEPSPPARGAAPEPALPAPATPAAAEQPAAPVHVSPQRYVVGVGSTKSQPPAAMADLAGQRFVVVEGDDASQAVGAATAAALRRLGADGVLLGLHHDTADACAAIDGVVHLGALRTGAPPVLPHAFATLRAAIVGGARWIVVATGSGGRFGHAWDGGKSTDPTPGLGVRGLVRTMAREYPEVLVRAVDVDPEDTPERISEHLVAELGPLGHQRGPGSAPTVVGYLNGTRSTVRVVPAPLVGPPGEGGSLTVGAAVRALGLGAESVVLLTGGGRGITAACAVALGAACGCRIELLGRSPFPGRPEHPDTAAAQDAGSLRRVLLGQGMSTPAQVEPALRRIVADRELRATLARLAPVTTSVRYHSVDVSDASAVARVVEEIHGRWGRIDGVIHGAGVIEDRMLADKTKESFHRVFSTKVDGARALAAALAGYAPVGFFALFGSVSGVFGNPGQVDYAAANDALDTLAGMWVGRLAAKVVAVDWGPWASSAGGMVSAELEREYARRGIGMIAPADGVAALFGELAWGDREHCQVVYMGGGTEAFAGDEHGVSHG